MSDQVRFLSSLRFKFAVLLARIRALMRRLRTNEKLQLQFLQMTNFFLI